MSLTRTFVKLFAGSPVQHTSKIKKRPAKGYTERQLIELESEIGSRLFGPIPAGHRRDFFCLDARTWVWHEEWIDENTGKRKTSTTRYEAHENGVLKAQDGINYHFIEGEELVNLAVAVRLYYEQTMREVYKKDPFTGQMLGATA